METKRQHNYLQLPFWLVCLLYLPGFKEGDGPPECMYNPSLCKCLSCRLLWPGTLGLWLADIYAWEYPVAPDAFSWPCIVTDAPSGVCRLLNVRSHSSAAAQRNSQQPAPQVGDRLPLSPPPWLSPVPSRTSNSARPRCSTYFDKTQYDSVRHQPPTNPGDRLLSSPP